MEQDIAVSRLSALAQDTRLQIFRLLIQAGPNGLAAGAIAATLRVPANTLSAHLNILAHSGLVIARRESRSRIYAAKFDAMRELLVFLLDDCCQGRPELCAPLFELANGCTSSDPQSSCN